MYNKVSCRKKSSVLCLRLILFGDLCVPRSSLSRRRPSSTLPMPCQIQHISDVRMPGKDGIELLGLIREDERLERVPVILLTAKALTQDRVLGYKVSCSKTKKSCAFVHHFQAVLCCYKPQKLCKH